MKTSPTQLLLATTADLIVELGWGQVSTRKVASAASLSPSIVHYHFRSIDDLRGQAALAGVQVAVEELVTSLVSSDDAARGITAGFKDLAATCGSDSAMILMNEAALAATREPELGRCLATLWDHARRTIADWLRAVAPHIADPDAVAATIAATIDGAAIQHSIDPRTRLDAIAEQLTTLAHPSPSPEGKAPPDEH